MRSARAGQTLQNHNLTSFPTKDTRYPTMIPRLQLPINTRDPCIRIRDIYVADLDEEDQYIQISCRY